MMDNKLNHFDADWDKILDQLEAAAGSGQMLNEEEEQLLAELQDIRLSAGVALKAEQTFDTDRQWAKLREQIVADEANPVRKQQASYRLKYWVAAAAVILVIAAGLFYRVNTAKQDIQTVNIFKNDIAPGEEGATLTLSDGKKIVLSEAANGSLAKEYGVQISKTAGGQIIYSVAGEESSAEPKINTLTTIKGQTYRLVLPDHSEVWLNAASSIRFPTSFSAAKERRVELKGEAYFEIAKDKNHPFIVHTADQELEVLGTHFNINGYHINGDTRTTLVEGSVSLSNREGQQIVLTPGQQGIVGKDQQMRVVAADLRAALAWKNGYFRFEQETIEEVMAKISRWYDIQVSFEGPISNEKFSGNISRYKNISEALNMLSYSNAVKFKVEGRRVTVMK